ncbi:MAG: MOSC N-terminal beta barrel domain-containing protein [Thermoleophilia bacterium]
MIQVSRLSVTPVKGFAVWHPDEVALDETGVPEDRRFYLVDEDGLRFGALRHGPLVRFAARYDATTDELVVRLPDGSDLAGTVEVGASVTTDFYGRDVAGHVVRGPWADAVSADVGRTVRIVRADRPGDGVDRGNRGGVTLLSDASVQELSGRSGEPVDARRFRMLIAVSGTEPHEEDTWIGGEVEVGEARVRVNGHVGRCAITTQSPETGIRDFDSLRAIKDYRGQNPRTREIDFGVYGQVTQPGRVHVGDEVRYIVSSEARRRPSYSK